MTKKKNDEPYLKFLSSSELDEFHETSLQVLRETGVRIDHEELRGLLSEEGAVVDGEENLVSFPPSIVEAAIKRAPATFKLSGRSEKQEEISVGGGKLLTHTTGGPSYIRDLETGERRDAKLEDVRQGGALVDSLENIHAYSPLVSPTDVISGTEEIEMVNAAIRSTEKVIENPASSGIEVDYFYDLFTAIAGSEEKLKQRPHFTVSVSPMSPLNFDRGSSEALLRSAQKDLPTKVLPAPITGATAPVTFAGALAQQNAELLAGLTILQTIKPGLRTVMGPRLSVMDMRSSFVSWGTQELGMASACAVQLIDKYDLPSDVYGLSSDAKIMDEQQGYEKSLNGVLPALAGADFLSGAGGLESLKSCSLAQLVVDNEIFGTLMDTLEGFAVNKETLGLDLIDSVGPGGDFLRERHTAKFSRAGEQYQSDFSNRETWEYWVAKGEKDIGDVAREEAKSILLASSPPALDPGTEARLDEIMEDARNYFKSRN